MKRISIVLFVASVALLLFSLANLSPVVSAQLPMPKDDGGGSDPTGAPATPVEVTNSITGTMAVKNFPLRQEVFGTVDVGNLPLASDGSLRTSSSTTSQQEIAIGRFLCPIFSTGTIMNFKGTPGITNEGGLDFSGSIPSGVDPEAFCDAKRDALVAIAQSLGCATDQDGGRFVCQGSRDEVVNVIGELFRELLRFFPREKGEK